MIINTTLKTDEKAHRFDFLYATELCGVFPIKNTKIKAKKSIGRKKAVVKFPNRAFIKDTRACVLFSLAIAGTNVMAITRLT